jgi:hypothetical protein
MRICLLVVATMVGCSSDARPECHAAVAHYYAAGCTVNGGSETSAEDQCTSVGDDLVDECRTPFDMLITCLDDVPATVSSQTQCDCDADWESAIELCD